MNYYSLKLTHLPTETITFTTYACDKNRGEKPEEERAQVLKEIAEGDGYDPQDYRIDEPQGSIQDLGLNLTRDDWQTMTDNLLESYNYSSKAAELVTEAFKYIPEEKAWKYYRDILLKMHGFTKVR
jgi:hypothetical protein